MENNETHYCYYSGLPSPMAYLELPKEEKKLSGLEIDRIIEMAWEDRTPFEAIEYQFGLKEAEVKALMKSNLKAGSYRLWRERVKSSTKKHALKRNKAINRFKCNLQRIISGNKISKRF